MTEMNALVPASGPSALAMQSIDPAALNYGQGLARMVLDEYISSRNFPGEQYGFKNGEYTKGFGKKAVDIPRPFTKVVNVPALMVTWRIWDIRATLEDPESGRLKVTTLPIAYPFAGQQMATEDQIKEKYAHLPMRPGLNGGKEQFPWERMAVMVIRDEKSDQLDHISFSSFSGFRAVAQLAADVEDMLRNRPPALPIIKFNAKRVTSPDGKMSWYVPTFEIVGWSPIKECDKPGSPQALVFDEPPSVHADDVTEEPVAPRVAVARPAINRAEAVEAEYVDDELDAQPVQVRRRPRVTN